MSEHTYQAASSGSECDNRHSCTAKDIQRSCEISRCERKRDCQQFICECPCSKKIRRSDRQQQQQQQQPPELPPRPAPRLPQCHGCNNNPQLDTVDGPLNRNQNGIRKYVIFCLLCGGSATLIGALFLGVSFMLRSYTSTLEYLETIPTFVPALLLITLGITLMSLASSRNRYGCLIKSSGGCCIVSAFVCILVTVTTTLVHMSRLQTLRECVYTLKTRTCTCFSVIRDETSSNISLINGDETDDSVPFIFNSIADCEIIHGALYSCLRAIFGLSVTGVLVCVFSSMLAYQLLNHEKKKMYWDQLEMRYRTLYQQPPQPSQQVEPQNLTLGRTTNLNNNTVYCNCCGEYRYPASFYQWDQNVPLDPFWNSRRIGNYYAPNPVDNERHERRFAWNWCRLPWTRSAMNNNNVGISSNDSQYGFGSNQMPNEPQRAHQNQHQPISIIGNVGSHFHQGCHHVGNAWGPPPPYSDPNSPRRNLLQSPNRHSHRHRNCTIVGNICQQSRPLPQSPLMSVTYENSGVCEKINATCLPSSAESMILKHDQNESDVYFADVSSCCNANDESSMSVYGGMPRGFLPKDFSENSLNSTHTQLTETTDDDDDDKIKQGQYSIKESNQYEAIAESSNAARGFNSNLTSTIASVNKENACFHHKVKKRLCKHSVPQKVHCQIPVMPATTNSDDVQGSSDTTMDSGWQSGPERLKKCPDEINGGTIRSINV